MECDTRIPRSRRPITMEDDRVMRVPTPSPPLVTTGGITLSDSEKETQFQPVTDPSAPAVIEMVDAALRSYFMTPDSQPN